LTEEAAEALKTKFNSPHDYDEFLQEIIKHSQNKRQIVYEKKYFDYLPNDGISDSEDSSLDSPIEDWSEESHLKTEGRKFKRQTDEDTLLRKTRQGFLPIPLYHYSPYPNLHFYYPFDLFSEVNTANENRIYSSYNNPWTPQNNPKMKFHSPYNYYLPPATQKPHRFNNNMSPNK
jgi:hypothetical protein